MNYLEAAETIGNKEQNQNRSKPKRRSVFYQQTPSLVETEEKTNEEEQGESGQDKNINKILQLKIFQDDPYLKDHAEHFQYRNKQYNELLDKIEDMEGGLMKFANSYKQRGLYVNEQGNIIYKEWAPGAKEMYLTGEFCDWDRKKHRLDRDEFGNWSIELPKGTIPHNTKVKVHLLDAKDQWVDRIPIYIRYATQFEDKHFDGVFWNPEQPYVFQHKKPSKPSSPKIYECHIGMSGVEPKVHSFSYFKDNIIKKIRKLGYNQIQIMAVAEHAYYGSFGYHVTLPFAISSRFGTPEEFKELIDEAHKQGLQVLIDIVHSHAASNTDDGFNKWDGTDGMYFHEGDRGYNTQWDSQIYNYGNWETLRLLTSNILYFMQEYQVDGFRFDGVTSMLYTHHGIGVGFTGGYSEYFGDTVDVEAVIYLMLANKLIHQVNPDSISIAEDVSGYPTLCRSHQDGGVGFDFRLQMAIPDKWIKLLKEVKDDDWNIGDIVHTLTNRRHLEPCITYCESHDQALVGDKTLAMWLFDKEIYENMSRLKDETIVVSRGMALHKIIRLLTLSLGGEGYLNFMGNEFGHPEWIDFPREGNNWSYQHCRRRWDICDDELLRFSYLKRFERSLQRVEDKFKLLSATSSFISQKHEENKIIVFEKGNLLFVVNLHPTKSFENYKVGTNFNREHIIVLDTDESKFDGQNRLSHGHKNPFPLFEEPCNDRKYSINIYIPSRTAIVLTPYYAEDEFQDADDLEEEQKQN